MISTLDSSTVESVDVKVRHADSTDFNSPQNVGMNVGLGALGVIYLDALIAEIGLNGTNLPYIDYIDRAFGTAQRQIIQSQESMQGIASSEPEPLDSANVGCLVFLNAVGATHPNITEKPIRPYRTESIAVGATDFPGVDHLIESVISSTLYSLLRNSDEEIFEDGMESEFSRKLHAMIRSYGPPCVSLLGKMLKSSSVNGEVASEALRQVGLLEHPQSHTSRLKLLTRALKFIDPRLRDAASIGISSMNDSAAIPDLKTAISVESSMVVKRNLNLVLDQFQDN